MSNPDPRAEISEYVSEQVDSILKIIKTQRKDLDIALSLMTPSQQEQFYNIMGVTRHAEKEEE